ncbi:MAG: beta-N-acetylhexosaminidase [Verrucomicrobiota bacterium]
MIFEAEQYAPKVQLPPVTGDGFRLHCSLNSPPRIKAETEAGQQYAAAFLGSQKDDYFRREAIFQDNPLFAERGFMLDISRDRVPTMEFLFALVDWLAALRYNQLQLYTEHTFAFAKHETVWKEASPLTKDEVQALEKHCAQRQIELVPNQNCFGHMERWLRHSDYQHLAECPNGFNHPVTGPRDHGTTLYPSKESEHFVREILDEVLPIYRSKKANIGGDEPWELGQGRSREMVEKHGKHSVYLPFLETIFEITTSLGKEPIFWADIILERPKLVEKLPKNVIPAIWGYHPDHPFAEQCEVVSKAGFRGRFQVVPGSGTWNSFTGRLSFATRNIESAATNGFNQGARGLVLTCWGDGGHQQATPSLFPSLVLAALASWSGNRGTDDLGGLIDQVFYPSKRPGHGQAIVNLGRVDEMLPYPNHNQSFLHAAFFSSNEKIDELSKLVDIQKLERVCEWMNAIPTDELDPSIQLAKRMNLWAAHRCAGKMNRRMKDAFDLDDELKEIKRDFSSVWLAESRIGGLEDSLKRFPG